MQPNPTTKSPALLLTDRDYAIFRLIRSDGAKTSAEIEKRFWDGKSRKAKAAFQRIRRLINLGLLERGNPKFLYLSDRARNLLAQHTQPWDKEVKLSA
jgi:hypothetical protein